MEIKNMGEVISLLRKQRSMTQEELGSLTDLSRVIIAKIENSQRAISLEEAMKIANVLEINIEQMYGYIMKDNREEQTFVVAFRTKGMSVKNLKEVKRIELLVDALFNQEEIRGE